MKLTREQQAVLGGERGGLLARYLQWSILWEEALDPDQPVELLTFDRDDLRTTYRKMNRMEREEPIDTVALGCPFSSLDELREISQVLARQRVAPGVTLIVCTSRHTLVDARRLGYAGVIEEAGGNILSDICPGALR